MPSSGDAMRQGSEAGKCPLPCPICKKGGVLYSSVESWVECPNCKISTNTFCLDTTAVEQWNSLPRYSAADLLAANLEAGRLVKEAFKAGFDKHAVEGSTILPAYWHLYFAKIDTDAILKEGR